MPCREQLVELQARLQDIQATGAELIVVSADRSADTEALRRRLRLAYRMVSDADLRIAQLYGVRQRGVAIAVPSAFVVGMDGRIQLVHVARHRKDRVSMRELLATLRR